MLLHSVNTGKLMHVLSYELLCLYIHYMWYYFFLIIRDYDVSYLKFTWQIYWWGFLSTEFLSSGGFLRNYAPTLQWYGFSTHSPSPSGHVGTVSPLFAPWFYGLCCVWWMVRILYLRLWLISPYIYVS